MGFLDWRPDSFCSLRRNGRGSIEIRDNYAGLTFLIGSCKGLFEIVAIEEGDIVQGALIQEGLTGPQLKRRSMIET